MTCTYEIFTIHEPAYQTFDIYDALRYVRKCWEKNFPMVNLVNVCTGTTLLYYSNNEEDVYMTPETQLMWLGFMMVEEESQPQG